MAQLSGAGKTVYSMFNAVRLHRTKKLMGNGELISAEGMVIAPLTGKVWTNEFVSAAPLFNRYVVTEFPRTFERRRKEGEKRFAFISRTVASVARPAYISSGKSIRICKPRILCQPRMPETAINPSSAETMRKRRLFPVLTAAKPRRSVMAI
jgi:hypothetical protein